MENKIIELITAIAGKYQTAKDTWMQDRNNAFKDGYLLGYYEICNTLKNATEENLSELKARLTEAFTAAKNAWMSDKKNPWKDGRLLSYYETLRIFA